jgi:transcriptional regulator with XRE-family HTH domain
MSGHDLKQRRITSGVSGDTLCKRAGISRTKLSNIERGYVVLTPPDAEKIIQALDDIVSGREKLIALASSLGLSGVNTLHVQ